MYIDDSMKKYLDDLSARIPAPGGGSASALVGATGLSCLLMVANFTTNKKGYEQYQNEIKKITSELESIKDQSTDFKLSRDRRFNDKELI